MKAKNVIHISMLAIILVFASCGADSSKEANAENAREGDAKSSATNDSYNEDIVEAESVEEAPTMENEESFAKDESKKTEPQSNLKQIFSSSAAAIDFEDTIHKFIRTADIRFKVNNVAHATYQIEDITRKFKGFVTYTSLNSEINRTTRRVVSNDSILETTFFTVQNSITIRVPSKNLDTTLKAISNLVSYLDYRVVSANDVRFEMLANKLKKKRLANYQSRMSKISDNGHNYQMEDKAYIEDNLLQKQEESDNTLIQDLTLLDQIEYSTVTLYLYQNEEMLQELVANEENIEEFRQGMGSRIWDSIKLGWYVIEDVVVGLIAAWPLWIILSIIFIILRRNGLLKGKIKE